LAGRRQGAKALNLAWYRAGMVGRPYKYVNEL
jgi:hypothetical protein